MPKMLAVVVAALAVAPVQAGRVDTVGGTTVDWQLNGPVLRTLINSEGHGVHVSWMYSASEQTPYPDRNTRYNYYDYATREWNWIDPDHMQSGVDVIPGERAGYGNLAANPLTGAALFAAHAGTPLHPLLMRDLLAGGGLFEYCVGPEGYVWPVVATGDTDWVHILMLDDATRDALFYSRCTTWCNWNPPVQLGVSGYQGQVIAASRVSGRVVASWSGSEDSFLPWRAYHRESTDRGATWLATESLPPPPAFGGDTVAAFTQLSAFPYYDRGDRLHFAAGVQPVVDGLMLVVPSEIWHWCRDNEPRWSRVHRAEGELLAPVGYNGYYACRPSIGEDASGGLYVAWEEFDGENVEHRTDRLRADIWWSRDAYDNGASWQAAASMTTPDSTSKRFPCVVDRLDADTLVVTYLVDLVAGFHVYGEGPATRNPVIVHRVPVEVIGVGESGRSGYSSAGRLPGIVRGVLRMEDRGPGTGDRMELLDVSGRKVMELKPGSNDVSRLAPGVYFLRVGEESRGRPGVRRVVLQR
ncbi:MAG: hypothetical protein R6X12_01960 [bacterium]